MVQGASEVVTPIVEITDQATTPMLKDIAQVATSVLEEIDGVVDPIICALCSFLYIPYSIWLYTLWYFSMHTFATNLVAFVQN